MGVPTDENTNFEMFGPTDGSDTTTIQGAIDEGSNGAVDSDTKFSELIAASDTSKFNSIYAGAVITNLNQITKASQYRGYPATSANNTSAASNFGIGNLIGHFGTTGYSTLTWRVTVNFVGYFQKVVTIGGSENCLHGCAYTSASKPNTDDPDGTGTIKVERLTDSSSNSNNEVNDDGDVQLVVSGGTISASTSNTQSMSSYDSSTRGVYSFSAGQTFDNTFTVSGLTVAAGDSFQLDITEG